MSNRQRLTRSVYFRRLVMIRQGVTNYARIRLWQLRILHERATAMALTRN